MNELETYKLISYSVVDEVTKDHIYRRRKDAVGGPPLTYAQQSAGASSEENIGQNKDEEHDIPSVNIMR